MTEVKPDLDHAVGETVTILGVKAKVVDVVPEDDWHWRVTLSSKMSGGVGEFWYIVLPTDYRTTDGAFAGEEDL